MVHFAGKICDADKLKTLLLKIKDLLASNGFSERIGQGNKRKKLKCFGINNRNNTDDNRGINKLWENIPDFVNTLDLLLETMRRKLKRH